MTTKKSKYADIF